ncbi:hypothetical protein HYC85_011263, partial [Camellia sinensis]
NCWPSVSGTETYVSIEYEASSTFDLQNVVISIPLPALREAPNVKQNDGMIPEIPFYSGPYFSLITQTAGQSENPEVNAERSNAQLDIGVGMGKLDDEHEVVFGLSFLQQETLPSLETNSNESHIDQLGSGGECSSPLDGPIKSGSSISAICTSSKPDFSKLNGEICLDNLSVRELHETFKATFGRETSVKDKQWLRRTIAMGLANSCDVPTTTL